MRLGDPAGHGRGLEVVGAGRGAAGSAEPCGRGALVGSGALAAAGARAVRGRHARDDLADGHRVAGLREDLLDRARRGGRDLGVDLVGGDLDDRLVLLDGLAGLLGPLEDRALGDRLAHRRHDDVDRLAGVRVSRGLLGASSVGAAPPGRPPLPGEISASTAPTVIVSPSAAWILATVPAAGEGTSASTLSVEISTSTSSSATLSPSCLCHSRTVPSETESPICGMVTSTVVLTAIAGVRPYRVPTGLRALQRAVHKPRSRCFRRTGRRHRRRPP